MGEPIEMPISVTMMLDLLWLLATSSKFSDGAQASMALDALHLPPASSEFRCGAHFRGIWTARRARACGLEWRSLTPVTICRV